MTFVCCSRTCYTVHPAYFVVPVSPQNLFLSRDCVSSLFISWNYPQMSASTVGHIMFRHCQVPCSGYSCQFLAQNLVWSEWRTWKHCVILGINFRSAVCEVRQSDWRLSRYCLDTCSLLKLSGKVFGLLVCDEARYDSHHASSQGHHFSHPSDLWDLTCSRPVGTLSELCVCQVSLCDMEIESKYKCICPPDE